MFMTHSNSICVLIFFIQDLCAQIHDLVCPFHPRGKAVKVSAAASNKELKHLLRQWIATAEENRAKRADGKAKIKQEIASCKQQLSDFAEEASKTLCSLCHLRSS